MMHDSKMRDLIIKSDHHAFSADGKVAVVGEPFFYFSRGRAIIYRIEEDSGSQLYNHEQIIRHGEGCDAHRFGWSMDCNADGTLVVVGAPGDKDGFDVAGGMVYVFQKNEKGWHLTAMIRPQEDSRRNNFGHKVKLSLDEKQIIVSATGELLNKGAVYVFSLTEDKSWGPKNPPSMSWTQTQRIENSMPEKTRCFGATLELNEDGKTVRIGHIGNTLYMENAEGIHTYKPSIHQVFKKRESGMWRLKKFAE